MTSSASNPAYGSGSTGAVVEQQDNYTWGGTYGHYDCDHGSYTIWMKPTGSHASNVPVRSYVAHTWTNTGEFPVSRQWMIVIALLVVAGCSPVGEPVAPVAAELPGHWLRITRTRRKCLRRMRCLQVYPSKQSHRPSSVQRRSPPFVAPASAGSGKRRPSTARGRRTAQRRQRARGSPFPPWGPRRATLLRTPLVDLPFPLDPHAA